jgi:hypothetical protein
VLSVEAIDTPAEEETGHSASARIVIHVEVSSSFGRASYSCTVEVIFSLGQASYSSRGRFKLWPG